MKKYVCKVCGHVYDPANNNNIPFEELPDDWTCPLCGVARLGASVFRILPKLSFAVTRARSGAYPRSSQRESTRCWRRARTTFPQDLTHMPFAGSRRTSRR